MLGWEITTAVVQIAQKVSHPGSEGEGEGGAAELSEGLAQVTNWPARLGSGVIRRHVPEARSGPDIFGWSANRCSERKEKTPVVRLAS